MNKYRSLIIFDNLLSDPVYSALVDLLGHGADDGEEKYCSFMRALYGSGDDLTEYLLRAVCEDENIYTRAFISGSDVSVYENELRRELELISEAASYDGRDIRELSELCLPEWKARKSDFFGVYKNGLADIFKTGFGIFKEYPMFLLGSDGNIEPVIYYDRQRLDGLFEYDDEREKIVRNTEAFIAGEKAANVLLYGDAGTGKSSTVKALANEYFKDGLRLVEVKKNDLGQLIHLMERLSENPLKFIIFIDDLIFDSNDDDFGALKSALEGSSAARASNILIYVTSNYRHLIKESESERMTDEINAADRRQGIISLSSRFGLTITFLPLSKEDYLSMIAYFAEKEGLRLGSDRLSEAAERYAMRAGGRNPRTAKQFTELMSAGIL